MVSSKLTPIKLYGNAVALGEFQKLGADRVGRALEQRRHEGPELAPSSASTMAFTGPMAEGTMEIEVRPMPTSPMASSGRPPSSPHSVTGLLWALPSRQSGAWRQGPRDSADHSAPRAWDCRGRRQTGTAPGRWSRSRRNRRSATDGRAARSATESRSSRRA